MILNEEIAEIQEFRGWYYGTLWSELKEDKINIGIFSPRAVEYLSDYIDLDITTFYITASDKERLMRQLNREKEPDVKEIIRRYQADEEDFSVEELKYLPNLIEIKNPNIDLNKQKNINFNQDFVSALRALGQF